jgi:23S rRNA (uracil-5-)-methyltransferase RumA
MSPEAARLLDSVHAWARAENLEPYNLHRQTGFLRHLVVREAKGTPDRMVLLVTSPGALPRESFVKAVLAAYPATTVLWGVNRKKADVAKSDKIEVLLGPGTITDSVLGRRFRISPHSFFQTNTKGAEALYARIKEWLGELEPKNLLDLYCGSGGISLCVADRCDFVLGIEEIASAVADAQLNAAENGVKNAQFMEAKVEDLLPTLAATEPKADVVILDPPRSGVHPSALKALKQLCPQWVVYVSCSPKSMAEDVARLADCYELKRLEAFDLFPHTEHVEALGLLRSLY